MNINDPETRNKFKFVAPDGGWGYMVILGATINLSAISVFHGSFGLLYQEFSREIGMTATHLTTVMSIYGACASITSFITHHLLSVMSPRKLYFLATLFFNIGVLGSVFVNTVFSFYICMGFIQGVGTGVIFNLSFTMIYKYFVERRLMAISICQTAIAIIAMTIPMLVKISLEEYGYRGTLLMILGITINNFFGVALMQPVEWHMKKTKVYDDEISNLSLNLLNTPAISEDETPNRKDYTKISYYRKIIDSLIDESIRKMYLRSCVGIGTSFCMFDNITYVVILPQALFTAKWNQYDVAIALSVMAFGDLGMRLILIVGSNFIKRVGNELVYVIFIAIALGARLGTLWSKGYTANMIFIALSGMANCCSAILTSVVVADAVPYEKFSAAMGMTMFCSGMITLAVGPIIGVIRDLTNSYEMVYYLYAACFGTLALLWSIEMIYKKNKHKKVKIDKDYNDESL